MPLSPDQTCTTCNVRKPLSGFYRTTRQRSGYERQCRSCRVRKMKTYYRSMTPSERKTFFDERNKQNSDYYRNYYLKKRYGITTEERDAMWQQQEECCAVCGRSEGPFDVDHNHKTGIVREILCHPCNVALGFMQEDAIALRLLADYIERHSNAVA